MKGTQWPTSTAFKCQIDVFWGSTTSGKPPKWSILVGELENWIPYFPDIVFFEPETTHGPSFSVAFLPTAGPTGLVFLRVNITCGRKWSDMIRLFDKKSRHMLPLCTKSIHHFVNSKSCGAVQEFMRIPSSKVERQNLPFRGKSMDPLWFSTSMTQGLQRTDAPRAALLAYTWQAAVVGLVASPGSWTAWSVSSPIPNQLLLRDRVVCVW